MVTMMVHSRGCPRLSIISSRLGSLRAEVIVNGGQILGGERKLEVLSHLKNGAGDENRGFIETLLLASPSTFGGSVGWLDGYSDRPQTPDVGLAQ